MTRSSSPSNVGTALCSWVDTAPPIEGLVEGPSWESVPNLPTNFRVLASPKTEPQRSTRVKLAWDNHHLYVGFQCDSPDVEPQESQRDAAIFNEECVEIYLAVVGREDYWEFEGNSGSVIFDAHIPRAGASRLWPRWSRWNAAHVRYRSSIQQGKTWQATWALSWNDLGIVPREDMELRVRLCRIANDQFLDEPEASSWPGANKNFQEAETWGTLHLTGRGRG